MESRLSGLLEDMQKPLEEGMKVYKLYNDGFIVKTKVSLSLLTCTVGER